MNEKLQRVLEALYNNQNFQQACVEELCDRRIPDSSNFVTFFANKQISQRKTYFDEVENNFQQSIAGSIDQESKKQIDQLASKIAKASVFISPKDPAKSKIKTIIEEESKHLNKDVQETLLKNFETIAGNNATSFYTSIIATALVTLVESKKLAEPDQNKNLTEFYSMATRLILASKPKQIQGDIQETVLELIANTCDEKVQKAVQNFLNEVEKKVQLSATASSSETPCQTTKKNGRMLRYYQNGKAVSLIQNEELPDPAPSIEEAIKNFDLNENSNLLKFALETIEEKVRENFNSNNISDKNVIPATEAVFLTLCHQFNKEVDDNVLFAIVDPLSDIINDSPFTSNAISSIKDICQEISGQEVEFDKSVPTLTETPVEDDKFNPKEAFTIATEGEIPPYGSTVRTIEDATKSIEKSFLKIENLKKRKFIAPAIKKAKQDILGIHYKFVGEPMLGKTKKPPKHVSETERNLMGNLKLGKGKANTLLNNVVRTLKTLCETQWKLIKDAKDEIKRRVEAGEKVSADEIEKINEDIKNYNALTNPKILFQAISRLFLSELRESKGESQELISEEYLKAFEENHPELI